MVNRADLLALLHLSRWQEHIPFTVPATLAGVNLAASDGLLLDSRLPAVLAANILAVTFAFMINDIEDAPDDVRDPQRAARNAISSGEIAPRAGTSAALLIAGLALMLYATFSREAFAVGALTVILSWLYSWRGVRLKAWPVIDVVAHALMLSSFLFLAGYLAYDAAPGRVWWVALCLGLISAYGQLYNQLRDLDMDRAASLHNTASLLGVDGTRIAMYACLIGAALGLSATVLMGVWPLWLALIPALLVPLALRRRSSVDMRGTAALDLSGRLQGRAMGVAGVMMIVWLVVNLIG